ncbi:MAG: nicotinate phosphoribosyltransferase [Candidatus Omnitrophota bacterium]|jgi:nicotinate phosphoribosyltransferase|nr:MAG: nicotinate phosphoribosyltransferase [Candidatus Omnitrophota bacterium]
MSRFHVATNEEILAGKVTDAYFVRTMEILEKKNISKPVVMEIRAASFPHSWPWAVFAGLEEVQYLLEEIGKPLDLYCLDEGTLFFPGEPVGYVIGEYKDFCVYETALLGLLCQATGIATQAARCVKAAEGRPVLSFGARRIHPALAPLVDRNAYLGGCQGYSSVIAAEKLGGEASGTMPHTLILLVGDTVEATRLFDEVIAPHIPRISLIDTFQDEKFEALRVAEGLGAHLHGIRLDTPFSRRGDFIAILKEIRWELDLRGFQHVKIIASGGLNEHSIADLNPYCDGYGVGTAISNARVVDFSLDIVEMDGKPVSKRGKLSGRKRLIACGNPSIKRKIIPWMENDSERAQDLITLKVEKGKTVVKSPAIERIRELVLNQLEYVDFNQLADK